MTPARISAAGGAALRIRGLGFRPGMTGLVGKAKAQVADFSASQLLLLTPATSDGLQTVVVMDPATGGFSTLTDAITVGAAATGAAAGTGTAGALLVAVTGIATAAGTARRPRFPAET